MTTSKYYDPTEHMTQGDLHDANMFGWVFVEDEDQDDDDEPE